MLSLIWSHNTGRLTAMHIYSAIHFLLISVITQMSKTDHTLLVFTPSLEVTVLCIVNTTKYHGNDYQYDFISGNSNFGMVTNQPF